MPSSTSNSEHAMPVDAYLDRPTPAQSWSIVLWVTLGCFAVALLAWESYWRSQGVVPSYRNSDGVWAAQRRRIDAGEGDGVVVVGSSRIFFGLDLAEWAAVTGERPIQLALQGTSPLPVMEDLADDEDFTGTLVVGVTPGLFFSGFALRGDVVRYAKDETLSQRFGQWLSQPLLESWLAYYSDEDYALFTVLRRQAWPMREGVKVRTEVRKLAMLDADRGALLWDKVSQDAAYLNIARQVWLQRMRPPLTDPAALKKREEGMHAEIERAVRAVGKLRDRGVRVIFVRMPSNGPYLSEEERDYPRQRSWEVLLKRTGAEGVHFQDHAELSNAVLPEWSHMDASSSKRFTRALAWMLDPARVSPSSGQE